jgi:thymidylate synthase
MNNIDKQYQALLQDILDNGVVKQDRTGTGTMSVFGRQIRHKMSEGFPLLTTKKMAWKSIVVELLWFLRGDTNIKYLVDNGTNIWNGDAYKRYANSHNTFIDGFVHVTPMAHSKESFIEAIKTNDEFANKWGELGPIYGAQWRSWRGFKQGLFADFENGTHDNEKQGIDQIQNLINDLKTNPDSRRLMVNAWNVGELDSMVLPPCHYSWQVYTRELSQEELRFIYPKLKEAYDIKSMYIKNMEYENAAKARDIEKQIIETLPKRAISLMWNQRSVDTFLGLPFNIASYGLLLEIIAKAVNMVPDELIGNLGDVHLYSNHVEQAKEQIGRELTYKERYKIWFNNNYETGMEYNDSDIIDFDDEYYTPTPEKTREPFELPKLVINSGNENWHLLDIDEIINSLDVDITFKVENYQSHLTIKAPLSN